MNWGAISMDDNTLRISGSVRDVKPVFMGDTYFPVIFSNIGMSTESDTLNNEIDKAIMLQNVGTDIISDLTLCGNIEYVQRTILDNCSIPLSSVPTYEVYSQWRNNDKHINEEDFIRVFEEQVKRGVDILTVHATVFKDDRQLMQTSGRIIPCTSRGGAMVLDILERSNFENPYYVYFDDILRISKKYNVCISLGPTFRPGSV